MGLNKLKDKMIYGQKKKANPREIWFMKRKAYTI